MNPVAEQNRLILRRLPLELLVRAGELCWCRRIRFPRYPLRFLLEKTVSVWPIVHSLMRAEKTVNLRYRGPDIFHLRVKAALQMLNQLGLLTLVQPRLRAFVSIRQLLTAQVGPDVLAHRLLCQAKGLGDGDRLPAFRHQKNFLNPIRMTETQKLIVHPLKLGLLLRCQNNIHAVSKNK